MNKLMDMTGRECGNYDGSTAPDGYWLRSNEAPVSLPRLAFLDRIGQARFSDIWAAMLTNPAIAFAVMRGFAAEQVNCTDSFPSLLALEQAGILAEGTAIEVWS